jgi:hypothetical protein
LAKPSLVFSVVFGRVGGRNVAFAFGLRADFASAFSDGVQASPASPLVDTFPIFNRPGVHLPVFIPVKLGSVNLRPALEKTDAVDQECKLSERHFPFGHGPSNCHRARTLECRITDGVLHNAPSRVRALIPDKSAARPAMNGDDFLQTRGVALMNFAHARMVSVAQRALLEEFGTNLKVRLLHSQEFITERCVHM